MDKYNTPSQEVFDDMKQAATKIWQTYDNKFGYVDEKLEGMQFKNVRENATLFFSQFDHENQYKMYLILSDESRAYLKLWGISYRV